MKITATKDNLNFGVSAVQKAVSTKSTLPILSCIKIEAKDGFLYFSATDLEVGIVCHVPAEVVFEGAAVIPARYFTEIVRKLPDATITLELQEKNELVITYEGSQLTLKSLSPADFPTIPEIAGELAFQIKASLLKQMVKQTVFAAGTDEGRPLFTGILCEFQEDRLILVATDTHRLALRQGNTENRAKKEVAVIIPAKIMAELVRLVYEEEEICCINIAPNLVTFQISNIRIICRLLEGQFPNYRQVIPSQYKSKTRLKKRRLQEAAERIALFSIADERSSAIDVDIKNNTMTVSSQSELGQGYEQLNIENEGEDVQIAFNSKYLLDVFKILDSEYVTLEFTGQLSPCIVRPSESQDFLYLLLPVKT